MQQDKGRTIREDVADYDSGLKPLDPSKRKAFKGSFREFKKRYRATQGIGPVRDFLMTDTGIEMPAKHARQRVREEFRESEYRPEAKKAIKFKRR